MTHSSRSDGSTAAYYQLPSGVTTVDELIAARGFSKRLGAIFAIAYLYSEHDWDKSNLLPNGATQLQDLISYANSNAQMGEILRSVYRFGSASHSDALRDAKKIKFYAEAEIDRLMKYNPSKVIHEAVRIRDLADEIINEIQAGKLNGTVITDPNRCNIAYAEAEVDRLLNYQAGELNG